MIISERQQKHIQNIKSKISYLEFVAMIAILMALNSLALDVILPAMDQITSSLHAKNSNDQHYLIFMYLLGFGLTQLIFGFLSDKFGRKKPLISGLLVYCVACFLCNMATNYSQILILRFLQGAGAAATNVLTISMVRDLYSGRTMASTMSHIFLVFVMVPVIAPAIGQFLLLFGTWHIMFIFMGGVSFLTILWVAIRLPETLFICDNLPVTKFLDSCKIILTNREAVFYTLASSCLFGGLYAMLNMAKQIYVDIFQLGKWFPLAFAGVAISQAISSTINSKLVKSLGMRNISHGILISYITAASIMTIITLTHNGNINFVAFIILLFIIMFSYGMIGANFNALAMEHLGKVAGTAASFIGFAQITLSSILGLLIAQNFNGTVQPLALGFLLVSLSALFFILYAEKGKLFD